LLEEVPRGLMQGVRGQACSREGSQAPAKVFFPTNGASGIFFAKSLFSDQQVFSHLSSVECLVGVRLPSRGSEWSSTTLAVPVRPICWPTTSLVIPSRSLPFFNAKILIIRRFIVQNLCLEFRRNRTLSQNQGPNSKIAERYAFGTSLARGVRGLASPNYC
jgi:hypothetical protein